MQITEDFKIDLKHIYHGTGVGVNSEDYGIIQQELELMRHCLRSGPQGCN